MWDIVFYEKEDSASPVQEFLDKLPSKHRAKAVWEIEMLSEIGTELTMPYVKHIDGKLWELRIKFASDISRIFYFIPVDNKIVLLHGFVKKAQRTPSKEIKAAQSNLGDYERRKGK